MPNVNGNPIGMSNGNVVTSFVDSTETTSRTYTYPVTQNALVVTNRGKANITVTVNATPYTINPDQVQKINVDFTSFSISSASGIQHFEAIATQTEQKSLVGGSAWNGGSLLQLGNYRLWVDSSGRLRIKSSLPTSDTDGVVVGSQV